MSWTSLLPRMMSLFVMAQLAACGALDHERMILNQHGLRIGIQHDPSTDGMPPVFNSHPAELTSGDLRKLLSVLQVRGYSGIIMRSFVDPPFIPVFKIDELQLISEPMAMALKEAGPRDRVFFSVPDHAAPYNPDRIAGTLFIRNGYLHITLSDHYAFLRADTAGDETSKDPRDLKGMELSVTTPAKASDFSPEDAPRWNPFEKVHVSLHIHETLDSLSSQDGIAQTSSGEPSASPTQPSPPSQATESTAHSPQEALRSRLQQLSESNQELRSRLQKQTQELEALKAELSRLQKAGANSPNSIPRSDLSQRPQ